MIPIYKYEIKDGLADIIQAKSSIAYTSDIKSSTSCIDAALEQQFHQYILGRSISAANPNQFDLFYLESVLASIGWNKNDDVFDKYEAWKARHTPVDKPFNYMHNENDIIGHLTSSKVIDFEGNVIPDTAVADQLPDQFDIVVGSVLYRTWSDTQLQSRMQQIIEDIMTGKWCVSMECLFRNFDYAISNDQGFNKVLPRNDETSFLTKHLRVYGGTGEYGGYRIGRLLRDFTFSGKGLVDNPANPRSHITSFDDKTETSFFSAGHTTIQELNISEEETIMTDVSYKEQYDALKAELDQYKSDSKIAVEKELAELRSQIDELSSSNQTLTSELAAVKEIADAKDTKITALETELAEVNEKLTAAQASLEDIELKAVNAARKALLLERVDEAKADDLIVKFSNASQELFDALVDSLPVKSASVVGKCDEKDDEEDDSEKGKADDSVADVTTNIDEAEADDNIDMASSVTDEEKSLRSKASEWLSSNVLKFANKESK
jgi:hypothetical protein